MEKINKIKGALYGAIIGDALGAPLEFMPQEQIKSQFGKITEMIGGGWLQVQPGEGTDETALLLATACLVGSEMCIRDRLLVEFLHFYNRNT